MSSREAMYDQLQTMAGFLKEAKRKAELREAQIEELQRELAQAQMRVEELEAEVDSLTEQKDEPYV